MDTYAMAGSIAALFIVAVKGDEANVRCAGNDTVIHLSSRSGSIHSPPPDTGYCLWVLPTLAGHKMEINVTNEDDADLTLRSLTNEECTVSGDPCLDVYTYEGTTYWGRCVDRKGGVDWCKTKNETQSESYDWSYCRPCFFSHADEVNLEDGVTHSYGDCEKQQERNKPRGIEYENGNQRKQFTINYKAIPCNGNPRSDSSVITQEVVGEGYGETAMYPGTPLVTPVLTLTSDDAETEDKETEEKQGATPGNPGAAFPLVKILAISITGAVLVIILVLAATILRRRKIKRHKSDKRVLYNNATNQANIGAGSGFEGHEPGEDEGPEMINNVLYARQPLADEREVVENVLYGDTA